MYRNRKHRLGSSIRPSTSGAQQNESVGIQNAPSSTPAIARSNVLSNRNSKDESRRPGKVQKRTEERERSPSPEDNEIPASQTLPPSRYISQRSVMRSQSYQTARTQQRVPTSYFETVLQKCGVLLGQSTDVTYVISCDHLKFVINLRKELKDHAKFPENIQQFLTGLEDDMKTQTRLIRILSGCLLNLSNGESSRPSQESLMKDFLMVDILQAEIIEILLNKIKVLVIDEREHMEVELILTQLRLIDHIANGEMLCEKIFEILQLANNRSRQAIIRSLEDIVDLMRHNEVVQKLMEMIPNDDEFLTESSIDTFGNMCLNAENHMEICKKIVRFIKAGAPIGLLPCFTKFILKFNSQQLDTLPMIICELRSCLRWPLVSATVTASVIEASQRNVFKCISRSLLRSKPLFDAWLKTIQSLNRHKPIDLILLVMMMTINDERSVYIENIVLRRKIKSEVIGVKLLEETVHDFGSVLIDYSKVLFELIDSFLRDKNEIISNFSSTAYKLLFGIEGCDRKLLLAKLIGFVCMKRTPMPQTTEPSAVDVTTNALTILMEINKRHPIEMQNNGLQVLRILDRSDELSLSQYRMVMNILCSLAYFDSQSDLLKDHIDMLVKKQVHSSIRNVKNRGIISLIRVVDHIVWEQLAEDESMDADQSFGAISDLPGATPRVAANYIDLLLNSSMNCPNHLALCFDELASVFYRLNKSSDSRVVNKPFLIWVSDMMMRDIQEHFVVESMPNTGDCADLVLEFLYTLNTDDELESVGSEGRVQIAINVAGAVMNPTSNYLQSINILPSLFNLTRTLLYRRYDASLKAIDALLGAGIVLPKFMASDDTNDIFDEFEDAEATKVLDMHFHTVNYWRECISAFVSQADPINRKKVLTRLTNVIDLEKKIKQFLKHAPPDYFPPIDTFIQPNKPSKFKKPPAPKPAARSKKNTTVARETDTMMVSRADVTTGHLTGRVNVRKATAKVTKFDFCYGAREIYRQMDPDVMQLLSETLVLKYPLSEEMIGTSLGLMEFKFLMEDLTIKIESLFGVRKFTSEQQWQNIPYPADFVFDLVKILPKIMTSFHKLCGHLRAVIEQNDDDGEAMNPEMFSDDSNYVKICFGLCLRLLAALFTWPGFGDEANQVLLNKALAAIVVDVEFEQEEPSSQEIAAAGINSIVENSDVVLDLRSAVHMFHLVKILGKHADQEGLSDEKHAAKLCRKFLSKTWFALEGGEERGAECNILLDELLKGFFKDVKFSTIRSNVGWLMEESGQLLRKNDALTTFPCFNRANLPLIFRSLCTAFNEALVKKINQNGPTTAHLKTWESSCPIVKSLLELVKALDLPRNFTIFLKHAHIYIKLFLQHGMPIIEVSLRHNPEKVTSFLKDLQGVTRYLHTLCCDSKKIKNSGIIAQIPFLRETLEQLVFKIKGALAANKCSSAFWMGNLRNRGLDGELIPSQVSSLTRSVDSGEEDELPNEDEEEDDAMELFFGDRSAIAQAGSSATDTSKSTSKRSSRSRCF